MKWWIAGLQGEGSRAVGLSAYAHRLCVSVLFLAVLTAAEILQPRPAEAQGTPLSGPVWSWAPTGDLKAVLPLRERARIYNDILAWRLDHILPTILKEEGVDLWLVINFEYDEDPVYMTLVPEPIMSARRLSILLFHDGPEGFRKLTANWHGSSTAGPMYQSIFTDRSRGAVGQFTAVADYIRRYDPKKIAINYCPHYDVLDEFAHGNGLSAFHKDLLEQALDEKYRGRLVCGEKIAMRWYETRSPQEMSLYHHLVAMGHDLIREFFHNAVIVPDVTTTEEVRWWIRQRILDLGLETWFHPSIDIQRSPEDWERYGRNDNIIRRGDVIHCDVGIRYLGLATDMQHNAYVLRPEETEPPAGLQALYRQAMRAKDIILEEMKVGRTGNAVLRSALARARAEGINLTLYSHPVGFYGHGSGSVIGMTDKQEFVPIAGEHPLHPNTVYAIEYSVRGAVAEWGGSQVSLGIEDQMLLTAEGARMVRGYPPSFHLIR